MKLVTCMGGVWKLTDRKYEALLRAIARDAEVIMDDYGGYLGSVYRDVTDMRSWQAQEEVDSMNVGHN